MVGRNERALSILRSIAHELRQANPKMAPISKMPIMQYILDQYRIHQVTDQRLCRRKGDLVFMANTYLCYLKSTRRYQELVSQYYGRGERTVEDTAHLVGFRLPNENNPRDKAD